MLFLLVPKLQLWNADLEAPASRNTPSWNLKTMGPQAGSLVVIRKYRQARKHRHIGMDADIQARWTVTIRQMICRADTGM